MFVLSWLAIVFLSVFSCIAYGIVHDQITVRICIEYFTIGHPPVFSTDNPTLLGLGWGIIATWWVGVLLGIPLASIARIGSRPKRSANSLVRPMAIALLANGMFATLSGTLGYIAATHRWVWLVGDIVTKLPEDRHVPYLVALWTHSASYLGGALSGMILMVWVWRSRYSHAFNQAATMRQNQ